MLIIDKYTDFYDYFSYVYGVDKKVVFDRRGSRPVADENLYKWIIWRDRNRNFLHDTSLPDKNSMFHVLETGYVQYLIETENVVFNNFYNSWDGLNLSEAKLSLLSVEEKNKNYSGYPVTIFPVELKWSWLVGRGYLKNPKRRIDMSQVPLAELIRVSDSSYRITNPILSDTMFTRVLDPEKVWADISMYISSLDNDKDIQLNISDKDKAEIHGFDKQSFKHPIKY